MTGKSTSGGALMIGSHFIKGWARTQNHVTLSSAEAELIALVKCTAETVGVCAMMRDWGQEKASTIYADSSVALAVAKRKGAGKGKGYQTSVSGQIPTREELASGTVGAVQRQEADDGAAA